MEKELNNTMVDKEAKEIKEDTYIVHHQMSDRTGNKEYWDDYNKHMSRFFKTEWDDNNKSRYKNKNKGYGSEEKENWEDWKDEYEYIREHYYEE